MHSTKNHASDAHLFTSLFNSSGSNALQRCAEYANGSHPHETRQVGSPPAGCCVSLLIDGQTPLELVDRVIADNSAP
jgi:hypothetical protein